MGCGVRRLQAVIQARGGVAQSNQPGFSSPSSYPNSQCSCRCGPADAQRRGIVAYSLGAQRVVVLLVLGESDSSRRSEGRGVEGHDGMGWDGGGGMPHSEMCRVLGYRWTRRLITISFPPPSNRDLCGLGTRKNRIGLECRKSKIPAGHTASSPGRLDGLRLCPSFLSSEASSSGTRDMHGQSRLVCRR